MRLSGVSQRLKEQLKDLIEKNRIKEALKLFQKLTYQENIFDEISAQLARLKEAQSYITMTEEDRLIELNKLRHAIYSLLDKYEDDFPHLSCDYAQAFESQKAQRFERPTDSNPITICFLIDLSWSMFGKVKDIQFLLKSMELSFEELSQKIDILVYQDEAPKSVKDKIYVSIVGMGMTPIEKKIFSLFDDSKSEIEPPIQSLLKQESMPLLEVIENWQSIKEDILSSPKGGNYNHLKDALEYARNVILKQNTSHDSLKIIFTVSDGEWKEEKEGEFHKIKKLLAKDNIVVLNCLLLKQNKIPYKYLPTLDSIYDKELYNVISLSSILPNNIEIYRTLNESKWEFEPLQSKLCIQLNEYSTFNELIEILITAVK